MPTRITFDITQTDYGLDPNEEYTISFENGFMIDSGNTANQDLDFITFTTDAITIDSTFINNGSKIQGVRLNFSRDVSIYTSPQIFLYYEDSTVLQTWDNTNLGTTWAQTANDEIELYITVAGELVDRTFFIVLADDCFVSNDRVLTKSDSWADSSVDLQYVGQHLEQLVIAETQNIPAVFTQVGNLTLAPYQLHTLQTTGITQNQTAMVIDQNHPIPATNNYFAIGYQSSISYSGQTGNGKFTVYDASTGNVRFTKGNPGTSNANVIPEPFPSGLNISDDYIVVGAPRNQNTNNVSHGAAYVYNMSNGNLVYTKYGDTPLFNTGEYGYDTALTSNEFAVSAPYEYHTLMPGNVGYLTGAVYVYNLSNGSLKYKLKQPTETTTTTNNYGYGEKIAMNSNYIAVAAREYAGGGSYDPNRGSGRVYVYNASNGTNLYTIDNPNQVSEGWQDYFGYQMELDGNNLIVSAYLEDVSDAGDGVGAGLTSDNSVNLGRIYIFDLTTGNLSNTIIPPLKYSTLDLNNDGITTSAYGFSIRVNNDYYIIGPITPGNPETRPYLIYDKTTLNLVQEIYPLTTTGGQDHIGAHDDYLFHYYAESLTSKKLQWWEKQ